jgi:hypothetical protein
MRGTWKSSANLTELWQDWCTVELLALETSDLAEKLEFATFSTAIMQKFSSSQWNLAWLKLKQYTNVTAERNHESMTFEIQEQRRLRRAACNRRRARARHVIAHPMRIVQQVNK